MPARGWALLHWSGPQCSGCSAERGLPRAAWPEAAQLRVVGCAVIAAAAAWSTRRLPRLRCCRRGADIDAAKAMTCVRTSINFVLVVSSSVSDVAVALPDVPVAPAGLAALVVAGPSSSVRILSIAETSVDQLSLPRTAVFDAVVLALAVDFSSELRWRLSSVTFVFGLP